MAEDFTRSKSLSDESVIDERLVVSRGLSLPSGSSPSLNGGKAIGGLVFTNPATGQLWVSKYVDGVSVQWIEKGSGGGGGGSVSSVNNEFPDESGNIELTTGNIPASTNKNYVTDAQLAVIGNTSGINSGNETAATIGAIINGAASATPNDTDLVPSIESGVVKRNTWTQLKAFLKNYYDTIYTTTSAVATQITTALSPYLQKNTAITGATKTKITYDANGLVTSGADATTADISDSSNKRYVTDAGLSITGNAATSSNNGYLSSTDWSAFNSKQAALVSGTNIKTVNGSSLLGSGDVSVGTVTGASVVSANGFSGSVANATTTPEITLSTTVTGLLKGNGASISAAVAGTDYESPLTISTGLTRATNTITNNLSTGVSGGQTVIGGNASGNNLTLSSTSNATKGKILFGNSAYDEVNNRLGIGTASPTNAIHVVSSAAVATFERTSTGTGFQGSAFICKATTTADMVDGFGNSFLFQIRDNAGVDNNIAFISGFRSGGADNSGSIVFNNFNAGVNNETWRFSHLGTLSNSGVTGTAYIHLKAGTATANTAPLKFTTGTNLTTAEAGALEYNNTPHFTNSDATRRHIALSPSSTKTTAGAPYTNDGYITLSIGGVDVKVMTTA